MEPLYSKGIWYKFKVPDATAAQQGGFLIELEKLKVPCHETAAQQGDF